jgi:PAS domain S-box-containing protein
MIPGPRAGPAMARKLADAPPDGVALIASNGAITLANWRLGTMFGYEQADVPSLTLESLIPALNHRAASDPGLWTGPEESGARLVGLRRDWTTFPVEVWLNPVITGQLTLAVIRDVTGEQPASPAGATLAAEQARNRGWAG